MQRDLLGHTAHRSHFGTGSRATIRKVDHSTIFPTADMDVTHGETSKGVPIVQPYGFAYWPKSQSEEQGKSPQAQTPETGGGAGGSPSGGALEGANQPQGKSAVGLTSYANGSRSDPSSQGLQDPRHQLMLEDPKQQNQQVASAGGPQGGGGAGGGAGGGQQGNGGKEGDVALYRTNEKGKVQQFHLTDEGPRLSSNQKTVLQIIEGEKDQQQQSAGPQQSGGQQQGKQEDGQRPIFKKDAATKITYDGETIHLERGKGHVVITDKKVICYFEDEKKSMLINDEHIHIRYNEDRVFIDKEGIWSTKPIGIKKDQYDQD